MSATDIAILALLAFVGLMIVTPMIVLPDDGCSEVVSYCEMEIEP